MSRQEDLEVECLAQSLYEADQSRRGVFVLWRNRCDTVRDSWRAAARRKLADRVLG